MYPSAARAVDVLYHIMTKELRAFYRMIPADELLLSPVPALTFCLAERGGQYIVYSDSGAPFLLNLAGVSANSGETEYELTWFDPVTGVATTGASQQGSMVRVRVRVRIRVRVRLMISERT